eukprot:m.332088 g.332088  ORF g.332088 m.332088 type:complete len:213 (-) comp16874_c0_seq1:111-749(-)
MLNETKNYEAHQEILSTCEFLKGLLNEPIGKEAARNVTQDLQERLKERFQDHWFPEEPMKGSGFRCIQSFPERVDPILLKALKSCLAKDIMATAINSLPGCGNFTIWIDPYDVSLRVGDQRLVTSLYGQSRSLRQNNTPRATTPEAIRKARMLSPSAQSFAPRNPGSPEMREDAHTPFSLPSAPNSRYPFVKTREPQSLNFWARDEVALAAY